MEENKLVIARNISNLRKKMKLSQAELAEKLNYSDKAISKWERGESYPDIFTFKHLADILGVTIDYFFVEHQNDEAADIPINIKNHNHKIITLLSVGLVWFIATIVFVVWVLATNSFDNIWIVFVYALPISSIVLLIFNTIWGDKKFNKYIDSIMVWSILLTIYLTISFYYENIWLLLLFTIGIPFQILIILWSRLKFLHKPRNKK